MVIQPRIPDLKLPFICPWHNKEEVLSLPPSYGGKSGVFEGEIPCPSSNESDVYLLAIKVDLTSGLPRLEKLKRGEKRKLDIGGPVVFKVVYDSPQEPADAKT